MTFNLKEWIAKVTQLIELLKVLKGIEVYGVSASGSTDVPFDGGEKGLIIGAGGASSKIVAVINTTSTGATSHLKVAGATNMTITNGTNKITIVNGYAYFMSTLVIKY